MSDSTHPTELPSAPKDVRMSSPDQPAGAQFDRDRQVAEQVVQPGEVAQEAINERPESERMAAPPLDPRDAADGPVASSAVIVRYGLMQQLGEFSHDLAHPPVPGAKVVVRTERGVELGEVVVSLSNKPSWRCITSARFSEFLKTCGPDYPFTRGGKVMRLANQQDIIDFRHLENSAKEEGAFCRQQIRELGLPMRMVTVEHLLGGERVVFYFSSETRIDFRELVHRIAAQFRTRIEMRQVGARDEARLVADYERCGQRCCCQEYLKDLKPVSMRMAKTQKATLDPSKISGRCSRLMCCLRYEDTGYEELRKKLPKKNIWVRTEKLVGKVIDTQIITQLVRLYLPDNTQVVVANEEILERDVPAPTIHVPTARPTHEPAERPQPRLLREEGPTAGPKEAPAFAGPETALPAPVDATGPIGQDQAGVDAEQARDVEGASNAAQAPGQSAPGDTRRSNQGRSEQDQGGRRRGRRRRRRGGSGDENGRANPQNAGGPRGSNASAGGARPAAAPDAAGVSGNQAGQPTSSAPSGQQPGDGQNRRRRRHRRHHRGGNPGGGGQGGGNPGGGGPPPANPA